VTKDDQARDWKDPDGRDEPGDDHPAGRLALSPGARVGIRSALLSGAMVAVAVIGVAEGIIAPSVSISVA
jgi:hypothetical protein